MSDSTKILPGDIEGYCLGLLSEKESKYVADAANADAGIKQKVDDFASMLEDFVRSNKTEPPVILKNTIFDILSNLKIEEARNIEIPPLINKYSDYKNWLHIVAPLLPEKQPKEMFVKELRNDKNITQTLLWASVNYPHEVHHDESECFIILKGRCRCFIGAEIVELQTGGYLEIPLHVDHHVEILEPVIAVVQRRKVA